MYIASLLTNYRYILEFNTLSSYILIHFICVYLMLQCDDLGEITVQLWEDTRHAYKELYHKEQNENKRIKEELEKLKTEISTIKRKHEPLVESPVSSSGVDKHYEHVCT